MIFTIINAKVLRQNLKNVKDVVSGYVKNLWLTKICIPLINLDSLHSLQVMESE